MKKVFKKFNRTLSIMLAAAMVLTMVPQTAMPVLAAENEVVEEQTETPDVTTEESGDPADVGETGETPANPPVDEQNPEEGEGGDEAPDDNETPVIDPVETPEEDPVEDPVEDPEAPVEGEVVDPTISTDMDSKPMADGESRTVTLPTDPEGYTITGNPTAAEGTAYTFIVTADDGWEISAVKYSVTGGETNATPEGEEPNFTIPGDKLVGDVTISVTAARITHQVTVTVDTPANVKTLTYSVVDGQQDQAVTSGTPITVNEGDSLTLKVVPADGYEVTVKKDGAPLNGTEDVYTIGEVKADVAVSVDTLKNSFTVTENITNQEAADKAKITYQNNCVTGDATKNIAKGTALTFKVDAAEGADLTGKKVEVSYKIGATGDETPLTADANGVYTVEAAKITDDVTIKVTVRALAQYAVTLTANDNITATYATGKAPAEADWKDLAASVNVTEDEIFNFKPVGKKYFKVTEVKVDGNILTATNGVYSFIVTEAVTLTVKAELDETQCNILTYMVEGDKGSATAVFSVSANDVGNLDGTSVEVGKTFVPNDAVSLKITQSDGYKIQKINGKEVTPNENGEVTHDVKFDDRQVSVKVMTDAVESVSENTITFVNNATKLTYAVTGDAQIVEVSKDKYTAKKGGKKLKFTITAAGSYEPVVTRTPAKAEGDSQEPTPVTLAPVATTPTKTGASYDYVVAASLLSNDTITIDEREIQKTVTLSGDTTKVDVLASVDGKTRRPDQSGTTYTVLQNDTVALRITAKANTGLVKVTSKVGESGKETIAKLTNGVANLEVKVSDNATVTIETKDLYTASKLKDKEGNPLSIADPKKNAYSVKYDGTYTADVVKGMSSEAVTLSEVKVLMGKAPVAAQEGKTVGSITDGTKATINLANAVTSDISGRALTVELYTKEGTGDGEKDVKVASYTLNVDALVKDIKIDKKPALTVKQAIDTQKVYTVTAAKGVDLNRLEAAAADADQILDTVNYDKATGKLTVKVKADKALIGKKATVTVAETGAAADAPKATVEIEAAALISDATAAPGVKLVAATDVAFKVTLSSDKKLEEAASQHVYYKLNTKRVRTLSSNTVEDYEHITYVKKTGASQSAVVTVADDQFGQGTANTYKVTATLVHTKEAPTADTQVAAEKLLGESKAAKEQTLKTQTPAYEDKLKLKKGASTIVTGQKDVTIATPQFNKYTTYLSLMNDTGAVKDISYSGDSALEVEVDDVNGDILVKASATNQTALGKHTIQVTAAAETGAAPSTATIVVTVVRGIHTMEVTVPSVDIYKPAKKAATLKATVVYNDDTTGKNKELQPKNKKVQWLAVAVDENGDVKKDSEDKVVPFDGVTVKNGTVTVNKDYIIYGDESAAEKDQFKIQVTAENTAKAFAGMDDDGKAIVGYSPVITITNQGADLNTIVLVGTDSKVIAQSVRGSKTEVPVTATALNGATVKVLPAGVKAADASGQYVATEEINIENLSYKSSKAKELVVTKGAGNVTLTVNKANIKPTLTVTANDGSKAKIEMKLKVDYDEVTEEQTLGLQFYPLEVTNAGGVYSESLGSTALAEADTKAISYAGTTRLAAKVMVKDGQTWKPAPDFANYEIKVTNGTKPELNANTAKFTAQKKKVTVTLTDKSKPKDKQTAVTYELTNNDIDETTKDKVAAKAVGSLHKEGTSDEQKVTINLDIPKTLVDSKNLGSNAVAMIDLDWTKMNAKNSADLYYFRDMLEKAEYSLGTLQADPKKASVMKGSFTLSFTQSQKVIFNQNSYALKVIVGTKATDGDVTVFTPAAAAAAVTVKVEKTKAFTFSPIASYTLLKKDMKASALLTGKVNVNADEYEVVYTGEDGLGLKNMNTKGKTNRFTDYFKISDDGKQIQLIGTAMPTKENLTGYLTYKAVPTKTYLTQGKGAGVNTVKITVKIDEKKTSATYSQSASGSYLPEIGIANGQKTVVNILAKVGKVSDWADLAYAAVKSDDNVAKNFKAEVTGSDGGVQLTYQGAEPMKLGQTLAIKLFVVPTNSYYTDEISKADGAAQNALIEKYGILVTVKVKTVEVKSPADQAKATLTAWLAKVNEDQPAWLKNGLTSATLLTKISDADTGAKLGDGVTVAVAKKADNASEDDYTVTAATLADTGSVAGNLTITVTGSDAGTADVPLALIIPAGAITKAEAKAAVEAATTVKDYVVTNDDLTTDKETTSNAICAAAQAVLGETYYTVSVKTQLSGTEAQESQAGSATITLTIKEAGNDTDTGEDVTMSYPIAALPATTA